MSGERGQNSPSSNQGTEAKVGVIMAKMGALMQNLGQ